MCIDIWDAKKSSFHHIRHKIRKHYNVIQVILNLYFIFIYFVYLCIYMYVRDLPLIDVVVLKWSKLMMYQTEKLDIFDSLFQCLCDVCHYLCFYHKLLLYWFTSCIYSLWWVLFLCVLKYLFSKREWCIVIYVSYICFPYVSRINYIYINILFSVC